MAGMFYPDSEMNLNISDDQLRGLLLETLKEIPTGLIDSSYSRVAQLAVEKNLVLTSYPQYGYPNLGVKYNLSKKDEEKIRDLFWDLLVEGLIRPGSGEHNQSFPYYHITEKGKIVIESEHTQP